MGAYKFHIDNTRDSATLIYLSEVYHADLLTMVLLYEKFGRDLFMFFYMFAGHQVNFPRPTKLARILEVSAELASCVKRKTDDLVTEQEKVVLMRMKSLYNSEENTFVLNIEVGHEEWRDISIEIPKRSKKLGQVEPPEKKPKKVDPVVDLAEAQIPIETLVDLALPEEAVDDDDD